MKNIYLKIITVIITAIVVFASCNKNVSSSSNNIAPSSETEKVSADATGRIKLVLQPGPEDGQDAYVYHLLSTPADDNNNYNFVPELTTTAWTVGGSHLTIRFFIRFDSLVKIPSNAKVLSATLQLFGLPGSSMSTPQGNSVYPKSPYHNYPDNESLIQRVTSAWDETSVTWATQPHAILANEDTIPISVKRWNYNPQVDVTNLVKNMVSDPSTNYGFRFILANEQLFRDQLFASSEFSDSTKRPKLTVIYKLR